jgi:hypothetical protein
MCILCRRDHETFKRNQRIVALYHEGLSASAVAFILRVNPLDVAYILEESA